MNTQTFAQAQEFKAITDEELMAVNGGADPAAVFGWGALNAFSLGIPLLIDRLTGDKVTKAVADT